MCYSCVNILPDFQQTAKMENQESSTRREDQKGPRKKMEEDREKEMTYDFQVLDWQMIEVM